ncbi:MAG: DUF484 family protein [Pseudomonadota bacterium]
MSSSPKLEDHLRAAILKTPDAVLDDHDLMRALVSANQKSMGANVVDLRGIAMDRLEARLGRLEDTHRSVIAAAYENLSGTNLVQRAILSLLEPTEFEEFLRNLGGDVAEILRVDAVRLVLESLQSENTAAVARLDGILTVAKPGFVDGYTRTQAGTEPRTVTLRQMECGEARVYGSDATWLRSEACLRLDLGKGRLPGLLVLGSEDPHQFSPQQGTDLLQFLAGVLERSLRHWLS